MAPAKKPEISAGTLLAAQPIFDGVDGEVIGRLARAATRHTLVRGEALFRTGDTPTGMYVVIYGTVRLEARGARGRRLTGVVAAGQSLGEPVMFLNRPAIVDAIAAEDCLVLHVPREAVLAEIRRDPSFAIHMLGTLSQRIHGFVQELERHASGSAHDRLVQYLVRQAEATSTHAFVLPATKAAVAAQLLVTPEHLSRLLRALASQGLVSVQGREVKVLDLPRLRRFSRAAASSPGD
jgi:CRP-like cAMP-binding protein